MIDDPNSQLYLFGRLPAEVRGHVAASEEIGDVREACRPVAGDRLHVTLAVLDACDAPRDYVAALVGWILSTIPPFAFRIVFDQLVVGAGNTLLKASDPLHGALACQAHVAALLRDYGVRLPRPAIPPPHVTLGYGGDAVPGVRGIDGISWLVDELVLVQSLYGRTRHVVLGQWRLPVRPGDDRAGRPYPDPAFSGTPRQMELWPDAPCAVPA